MRLIAVSLAFVASLLINTLSVSAEAEHQLITRANTAADKAHDLAGGYASASAKAREAAKRALSLPASRRNELIHPEWTYVGEVRDGMAHGYGVSEHWNGDRYEGEFQLDNKSGYGIFYFADDHRYEGQFRDNEYHGYGIYYYLAGGRWRGHLYKGEFRGGKKNGYGINYLSSGETHYAYWENNEPDPKRWVVRTKVKAPILFESGEEEIEELIAVEHEQHHEHHDVEQWLTRVEPESPEIEDQYQNPNSALIVVDKPYVTLTNLNVRERPGRDSTILMTLPKNSEITAVGKVENVNWYLVSRNGENLGYVSGTYIGEADIVQPQMNARNPHAVAVIIGNRNYEGHIPTVDYAHNDADAIKRFVIDRLGFDAKNIIVLKDATRAKLEATFGNERLYESKLWSYLSADHASDVMIYYSGHGVSGQYDQKPYILPTDSDPDQPEINGYSLDMLYTNLEKLDARRVTVLLDSCFSGDSHGGRVIRAASSASPLILTEPNTHEDKLEIVVLAAARGDQLASWDEEAQQGLFTRYFLEAVDGAADANKDGEIDLEEVEFYLDRTMTKRARRDFRRKQNVWVRGPPETVLVVLDPED